VAGVFGLLGLWLGSCLQSGELHDQVNGLSGQLSQRDKTIQEKTAEIQRLETLLTPFRTIALERFTGSESEKLKQLANQITELEDVQTKQAVLTEAAYLTVRAENGDRAALERLHELAGKDMEGRGPFVFTAADKNIQRILAMYRSSSIGDPWVAMETNSPPAMEHSTAVASLSSPAHQGRAWAVMSVMRLRLNSQIPRLIEIGATEPDLHVVQLISQVLPQMLRPAGYNSDLDIYDFVMTPDKTKQELLSFWQSHSNVLLAVRSKYWQEIPNDPYAPMWVLTDPEAERSAPGHSGSTDGPAAPEP
jgi:hypothetical protein